MLAVLISIRRIEVFGVNEQVWSDWFRFLWYFGLRLRVFALIIMLCLNGGVGIGVVSCYRRCRHLIQLTRQVMMIFL